MEQLKSKQDEINRRCFLSNCAKLSIGASLVALNLKSFASVKDTYLDYGYCIFKCPVPCTYDPSCGGCRANNALTCTARVCAIAKSLPSCAHCADLQTCSKEIFVRYPNVRQFAIQKQAEWGLPSGIEKVKLNPARFKVYPTFASDNITITNLSQIEVNCRLLTLDGRTVKECNFNSKEYQLDISDLISESYILNIFQNSELLYVTQILKK